jgi:hypothetical protein
LRAATEASNQANPTLEQSPEGSERPERLERLEGPEGPDEGAGVEILMQGVIVLRGYCCQHCSFKATGEDILETHVKEFHLEHSVAEVELSMKAEIETGEKLVAPVPGNDEPRIQFKIKEDIDETGNACLTGNRELKSESDENIPKIWEDSGNNPIILFYLELTLWQNKLECFEETSLYFVYKVGAYLCVHISKGAPFVTLD